MPRTQQVLECTSKRTILVVAHPYERLYDAERKKIQAQYLPNCESGEKTRSSSILQSFLCDHPFIFLHRHYKLFVQRSLLRMALSKSQSNTNPHRNPTLIRLWPHTCTFAHRSRLHMINFESQGLRFCFCVVQSVPGAFHSSRITTLHLVYMASLHNADEGRPCRLERIT